MPGTTRLGSVASVADRGARSISAGTSSPGTAPRARQQAASSTGATRIPPAGASAAASTSGRRGEPSSTSPLALTKANAASAAVAARPAAATAAARPTPSDGPKAAWTSACSVSHSEAKPFSGGTPAIASAPTRKAPPVQGIRRSRPPRRSRSSEPTARSKLPAARNSSALKTAWLRMWRSAAAKAIAAQVGSPPAAKTSAAPSPRRDDADVLDRGEGEQPLQVVLGRARRGRRRGPRAAPAPSTVRPAHSGAGAAHSKRTRISP